jgi:uncharacterized spore protein YtfJ
MSQNSKEISGAEIGPDASANSTMESVLTTIRATRDAMTVEKVFGNPYQVDGVTIIPAARVRGGAGGGAGEGSGPEPDVMSEGGSETPFGPAASREGSGLGAGFGIMAVPVGVYEIRDRETVWKPAVDVNRLLKGFQVLAGIVVVCLTLIRLRQP